MYRLVSVEYFMDKMNEWETAELINVLEYTDVSSWTQTRQLLSCWVDHKKVKKIQDIMRFPWDPLEERTQDQLSDEEKRAKKLRQREELRKITGF
jgi:hypothetical protein